MKTEEFCAFIMWWYQVPIQLRNVLIFEEKYFKMVPISRYILLQIAFYCAQSKMRVLVDSVSKGKWLCSWYTSAIKTRATEHEFYFSDRSICHCYWNMYKYLLKLLFITTLLIFGCSVPFLLARYSTTRSCKCMQPLHLSICLEYINTY